MAEVIVLEATANAGTSDDIEVTSAPVTVFLFATDGKIDGDLQCPIRVKVEETGLYQAVPDEHGAVFLTRDKLERTIWANGTYQVYKPATSEAVGIGTRA